MEAPKKELGPKEPDPTRTFLFRGAVAFREIRICKDLYLAAIKCAEAALSF